MQILLFSSAVGYFNEATGEESSAFGFFNDATESGSSAFGRSNDAIGINSSAFGFFNDAIGDRSSAVGFLNDAIGNRSSAFGSLSNAIGDQSSAVGHGTLSDVYGLMAVGHYNADPVGSATTWVDTEPVFVIGNGEDSANRSTAVTVLKNGKVGIGTPNPLHELHVSRGSLGATVNSSTIAVLERDDTGYLTILTPADKQRGILFGEPLDNVAGGIIYNNSDNEDGFQFRANGNVTRMVIEGNGDVGIGTTDPESKLEVVASSSSGSSNVATFRNPTSGVGSIKILGEDFSSVKFIDSGSGSVTESDFEIASIGDGRLVIRNADNANDGFGAFESIALFEPMSQTYQFVVFGDALASGGTFINSDQRLKRNINNLDNALDHLMQLQPKRYEYDHTNEKYAYLNLPTEPQIGLIAQEVEQIFPELVKTNNLNKEGKDDDIAKLGELEEVDGLKAINYVALVPVLIGAVQEQQNQIDAKDELIEAQNEQIESLEARLAKIEALLSGKVEPNTINATITDASLEQNAPNPFSEATTISYFIPENVKSASLQVLDQNGRIIKTIPIEATGKGQLTLQANLLSAGTYSYSLVLDGRVMETKQMVLTH